MTLKQTFSKKIKEFGVGARQKVAVAVSGGADSMALALLAAEYFGAKNIVAVTVDHGLRRESAVEALKVARWMKKYGIRHQILRWKGIKKKSNIQAEARAA